MHLLLILAALRPALAGDLALYAAATGIVEQHALHPEALVAAKATRAAAEAAEREIPWLIADTRGDDIVLRHGERGVIARIQAPAGGASALPPALEALEDAILESGAPIPDGVELSVTLLRGAMTTMDKPTMVLAGSKLDRFQERIRGTASGVGARVGIVGGELTIKQVFPDSPASRAGLKDGDVILRVDGTATLGMPVARAVDRIRGPEGTRVNLHIRRGTPDGPVELDIAAIRAEVVLQTVTWERLPSGVGLIAIDHFSERVDALMRQGLDEMREEGPLKGLILDLRGNSGGSMLEAAQVCDLLMGEGLIVRTVGRGGAPVDSLIRELKAHPGPDLLDVPVAVLVDDGSASASEIVAGALTLNGRAVMIGDRTYGKGTVQKLYTVRPGGNPVQLKITVAEYRLEHDIPVTEVGLAPDAWLALASFGAHGVTLPEDPLPPQRSLLQVQVRPGWRPDGAAQDRGDLQVSLAERALLASAGPSRDAVMEALDVVIEDARAEEDARLVRAFAARGLDWTPRPGGAAEVPFSAGDPPLSAALSWVVPPAPGGVAELSATVTNNSAEPLYRARLRLEGDAALPWDGLTLPVGHLAPGASSTANLTFPTPEPRAPRQDRVSVLLQADGEPTWALQSMVAELPAEAPAALAVRARLTPDGDHHKLELWVENSGGRDLSGLRLRLAWPEDGSVELLQWDVELGALPRSTTAQTSLGLRLKAGAGAPELDLVVDADQLPDRLVYPLSWSKAGETVRRSLPVIEGALPLSAPQGPVTLSLTVRDEQGVSDLAVWVDGEKVAWRAGTGRTLKVGVPIDVSASGARIVAIARDRVGGEQERRWYVLGQPADDGVAGEGP